MKLVLVCIVLLAWQLAAVYCENTAVTLNKVQAGIDAGKAIFEAISEEKLSKTFGKIGIIARKLAPFLGALGPLVSLISVFLPSPQMQYMKKEFAKIDANFNTVFNKFGELEKLIKETALNNQYHNYESNIVLLSKKLHYFLSATSKTSAHYYKRKFKDAYERVFKLDAEKLWNGMMYRGGVFAYNIPAAAMTYTNYHRRRTQNIMKGVLNLIVQGAKVELCYHMLNGSYHDNEVRDWDRKIEQLSNRMRSVDTQLDTKVKNIWSTMIEKEVDSKLADYRGYSNSYFADRLYSFLTDKYYWRDWHVVAYNPIIGWSEHCIKYCHGYLRFRTHGRNVAVASENLDYFINKEYVRNKLSSASTTKCFWGCRDRWARDIYDNQMSSSFTSGCRYPSAGVIKKTADVQHRAPYNRFVSVVNGNFVLYAFF